MMNYCVECGTKLEMKELKGEGMIPFCPHCGGFRFPIYNTAVSMLVTDAKTGRILLIQQYGRPFYILVAGYINRGERAEAAVVREVKEETGMDVSRVHFNRTRFFEPSNTLMCNFTAYVDDITTLHVNEEVDACSWFTPEEARKQIKQGSLAAEFLNLALDDLKEDIR